MCSIVRRPSEAPSMHEADARSRSSSHVRRRRLLDGDACSLSHGNARSRSGSRIRRLLDGDDKCDVGMCLS